MQLTLNLMPSGCYVDNTIKEFGEALERLINTASQVDKLEISSLKFVCGRSFENINILTLNIIISHRIPFFDAIIYMNLNEKQRKMVHWTVDEGRKEYSEAQISFSALFLYFMLMTRNKAMPDRNENIPQFLTKFMTVPMTIEDVRKCLSENNLNAFQHKWIQKIEIKNLSSAIKNRFKQGIAGMRLFTAIHDNEPDLVIDSSTTVLVDKIKELVNAGPFWEMHTLFQTPYLSSQSINANLNNLMLELYSVDKLREMDKNNAIFKFPTYNPRAVQYKTWGDNFFNEYKTKLNID